MSVKNNVRSAKPTPAQRRTATALDAIRHLSRADGRLAGIIRQIGPYRPIITRDPFRALAGAIVHQQVSMAAAATMLARLQGLCTAGRLTPQAILALSDQQMLSAGMSRQKRRYLRDLSEHFASGRLSSRKLRSWDDERVLEEVTQVLGVGRWTAEMLLIFCLERPDVWPIDDLGIQKALQKLLGRAEPPPRAEAIEVAEPWRPYRSYATWYLWRSLEGPRMPGMQIEGSE